MMTRTRRGIADDDGSDGEVPQFKISRLNRRHIWPAKPCNQCMALLRCMSPLWHEANISRCLLSGFGGRKNTKNAPAIVTGRGKLSRTARSRKFGPFRSASRWAKRFLSGVVAVRRLVHLKICSSKPGRHWRISKLGCKRCTKALGGLSTKHEGQWHPRHQQIFHTVARSGRHP